MFLPNLIQRKREGEALSPEEWSALIASFTDGHVPDYQMAALIMASFIKGLNHSELSALTEAMIASGDQLSFPGGTRAVDKHSTGGVGDKVSLILAPLVAACGVPVPMMSGRGLGHTTGTLDKLEAIPGFNTRISLDKAVAQVQEIGCALFGQTDQIAPADKKLYSMRDAIAAVESIPLISASIMSKKLCEGLTGLVLDVKHGSGAFLPATEHALELASTMMDLGEARGCKTIALLTSMDRPLGKACGNALETVEAIEALKGEGRADLMEVTYALGAEMLILGGKADTVGEARLILSDVLDTGAALQKFVEVIEAQDGDASVVDNTDLLPKAAVVGTFLSPDDGFVQAIEPRGIGNGIIALGGGRRDVDDELDPSVGFVVEAELGDEVRQGDELAQVFAASEAEVERGIRVLNESFSIGATAPAVTPLVTHRVSSEGVEKF
jgi:pyrimidine-nucleoside phosphorylase